MKKILSLFIAILFLAPLLPSQEVYSQENNSAGAGKNLQSYELLVPIGDTGSYTFLDGEGLKTDSLGDYINAWYKRAIGFVAVLAVLIIVIYGFQYSFSETIFKKTSARERIAPAVGGLILLIVAVILLETIDDDLTRIGALNKITVQGGVGDFGLTSDSTRLEDQANLSTKICQREGYTSRFSCGTEKPLNDSRDRNFPGGVNNPGADTSSQCYVASRYYCQLEEASDGKGRYQDEIADWNREGCKGVNGPCTVVDGDAKFTLGENACNRSLDGGNCRINDGLYSIFNKAGETLGKSEIVCTECGAPTVAHGHPCHSQGTCGDMSSNKTNVSGKLDKFTAVLAAGGFPVLEVQSESEQSRIRVELDNIIRGNPDSTEAQYASLMKTKIVVIEGINAEHFSVYSRENDADGSARLCTLTATICGKGNKGTNTDWDI